jgi:hypothetical protein
MPGDLSGLVVIGNVAIVLLVLLWRHWDRQDHGDAQLTEDTAIRVPRENW